MPTGLFTMFDQVRIINLVDRTDRRREMSSQLERMQAWSDNVGFFGAQRPSDQGPFPSLGARGCFESHHSLLRKARDEKAKSLLILEDDLDFTKEGERQAAEILGALAAHDWDIFHGAHVMPTGDRRGVVEIGSDEPVLTTSFVAFSGQTIGPLVDFLDAMLLRPAGSADYGPMHVDGAFTVFRSLYPKYRTFAAFPSLGHQRSSPSDVTPSSMILDRWAITRPIGALLRRGYNRIARS